MDEIVRELGHIKLVQLQPSGLIIETPSGYFYDVSRRVEVERLHITPRGIEATTADDILRAASTYLLPDQILYLVVGRWHDIAQDAPEGQSHLEKVTHHRVRHLSARDPLTLRELE